MHPRQAEVMQLTWRPEVFRFPMVVAIERDRRRPGVTVLRDATGPRSDAVRRAELAQAGLDDRSLRHGARTAVRQRLTCPRRRPPRERRRRASGSCAAEADPTRTALQRYLDQLGGWYDWCRDDLVVGADTLTHALQVIQKHAP